MKLQATRTTILFKKDFIANFIVSGKCFQRFLELLLLGIFAMDGIVSIIQRIKLLQRIKNLIYLTFFSLQCSLLTPLKTENLWFSNVLMGPNKNMGKKRVRLMFLSYRNR